MTPPNRSRDALDDVVDDARSRYPGEDDFIVLGT
jgi:hypothetical protein